MPVVLQNAQPGPPSGVRRVLIAIFTLCISEIVRACSNNNPNGAAEIQPVRPGGVPLAQPDIDQHNSALASNLGKEGMPKEHMVAFKDALDNIRTRFGESIVPPFNGPDDFDDLNGKIYAGYIADDIKKCTKEVTPEKLMAFSLHRLQKEAATKVMQQCYTEYAKEHNYQGMNSIGEFYSEFTPNIPNSDRMKQLRACNNAADVQALFTSLKDIPAKLKQTNQLNVLSQEAMQSLLSQLSQKTGIPEDLIPKVIDLTKASDSFGTLCHNYKNNPPPLPEMQAAFTNVVNKLVAKKMDGLNALSTMNISKELRTVLQNDILNDNYLTGDQVRSSVQIGLGIDTSSFVEFIRAGNNPTAATVAQFLGILVMQVMEKQNATMTPAEWKTLDGNEKGEYQAFSLTAAVHSNPEFSAALRSLSLDMLVETGEILHNVSDTMMGYIGDILIGVLKANKHITSAELADSIATQGVRPAYAGAIGTAINELREKNGANSLPSGYIDQWMQGDFALSLDSFKNQIRNLKETPSPDEVAKLFTATMQGTISEQQAMPSLLRKLSQITGIPDDLLPSVINMKAIQRKLDSLSSEFNGSRPLSEKPAAFARLVDNYIAEKRDVLDAVNTMNTSKELKTMLQASLLRENSLNGEMLRAGAQLGSSVGAASFVEFLKTNKNPTAMSIAQFLSQLGAQLHANRQTYINENDWEVMGGEGQGDIRMISGQVLLHNNQELLAALRRLPQALLTEVNDIFAKQQEDSYMEAGSKRASASLAAFDIAIRIAVQGQNFILAINPISSADLADTLVTAKPMPEYAGAISMAIKGLREKNGPRSLPSGYIDQWTHLKEVTPFLEDLKSQIRNLKETPSPDEVAKMFTATMQNALNSGIFPNLFD